MEYVLCPFAVLEGGGRGVCFLFIYCLFVWLVDIGFSFFFQEYFPVLVCLQHASFC